MQGNKKIGQTSTQGKTMRSTKSQTKAFIFVFLLFSFLFTGCAVLTTSQVKEVEKFAKASQGYSELPGALVQSYGILIRNSKLLSVTRKEFGQTDKQGGIDTSEANDAFETIKSAYKDEMDFTAAGKQMDAALSVLNIYSNLLTSLVSGNFSDALTDSAEKLGRSLDKATDEYNDKYKTDVPLKKVGGLIAMGIRSSGGLYIRQKQASILKNTINEANPLIVNLMDAIQIIASEKLKPSFVNYEKNYIGKEFKAAVNDKKQVDISTVLFVYDNVYKARQLIILSDQISKAAENYKKAHMDLVENTRTRKTLDVIRQIEALSKEVKAANKVKKDVGK
ncbi:MAG: hypothetical protein V1753_05650 [Pseudomonadota bacterium]